MKIPEGTDRKFAEVEVAASKDDQRPTLTQPYLSIEDGTAWLVATDSYVCARIPVETEDGDTEGVVPVESLKFARKTKLADELRVALTNGQAEAKHADASLTVERPTVEGKPFPDTKALLPSGDPAFKIVVNVDKLAQAGRAIGSSEVLLSFRQANDGQFSPMTLEPAKPHERDGRIALVMPIRLYE